MAVFPRVPGRGPLALAVRSQSSHGQGAAHNRGQASRPADHPSPGVYRGLRPLSTQHEPSRPRGGARTLSRCPQSCAPRHVSSLIDKHLDWLFTKHRNHHIHPHSPSNVLCADSAPVQCLQALRGATCRFTEPSRAPLMALFLRLGPRRSSRARVRWGPSAAPGVLCGVRGAAPLLHCRAAALLLHCHFSPFLCSRRVRGLSLAAHLSATTAD